MGVAARVRDDQRYVVDARGIARRFRRAAILGAFNALHPGETLRLYNDYDPLPLLELLHARYGARVEIVYVARGPDETVIDFTKRA